MAYFKEGTEQMTDTDPDAPPPLTLLGLWARIALGEEYSASVVERALKSRNQASNEAKQALTAAINGAVKDIPQFPNKPASAPPPFLVEPVTHEMFHSDKLAGAVLRVWAESHQDLHDAVVEHLDSVGMPAEYPNFKENRLRGMWPPDTWEHELEAIAEGNGEFDEDDVALMLCYVSGKIPDFPDDEEDGPYVDFSRWLERMRALPPGEEEWSEAREFLASAAKIIEEKEIELGRTQAREVDNTIADLAETFSPELSYLERGVDAWSADKLPASAIPDALLSAFRLDFALREYRPVRELAPVRSEEAARAEERRELESRILSLMDDVDRLMSGEGAPEGDTPSGQDLEETPTAAHDARSEPEGEPEAAAPQSDQALLEENDNLQQEVRSLQDELKESRHKEEGWRLSYVEAARRRMAQGGEDEALPVRDVAAAVELARDLFADELLFQLNSRSVVRNNPFEDPEAMLGALRWLATTYRRSRMGDGSLPDPDASIREACGWFYTSHQSEVTMGRYRDWYVTKVDGKARRLRDHVGKGNSKDPRHTIRIGFDWDKEQQAVIVGYIGQHQQTAAT